MNPLTCTDNLLHQLFPTLSISESLVVAFSGRFLAFVPFPCLVQKYNVDSIRTQRPEAKQMRLLLISIYILMKAGTHNQLDEI